MSSSYRPKGYGVSPALQRARQPYRLRNAVTGTLLVGFAVSVWAYSISAVKQDNFDDVDAAALHQRQNAQAAPSSPPPSDLVAPEVSSSSPPTPVAPSPPVKPQAPPSSLLAQFRPSLLDTLSQGRDSKGRLIDHGAPSLSKLGSLGDKPLP